MPDKANRAGDETGAAEGVDQTSPSVQNLRLCTYCDAVIVHLGRKLRRRYGQATIVAHADQCPCATTDRAPWDHIGMIRSIGGGR